MARENHRGKKYVASATDLNREELHDIAAAVTKVKSMAKAKFDETVDLAVRLGLDTKKSEQTIRGTVSMPSGTGKSVRVAVFAQATTPKPLVTPAPMWLALMISQPRLKRAT